MGFEDDPGFEEQSFWCINCRNGTITQNIITGKWECDNCDFSEPNHIEDEER